jgi:hypothetical protein
VPIQTVSIINGPELQRAVEAYNLASEYAAAHNAALKAAKDNQIHVGDAVKTLMEIVQQQHYAIHGLIEAIRPLLTQEVVA